MKRSYENVGRKPIYEKYIFNEDKYLRIIAFLFTFKRYSRKPRMLELQYELLENPKFTDRNKKKINDFFKIEYNEEEKKDWKKGINGIKDLISDDELYRYALKMSEWNCSDKSYSFFETLRAFNIYEQVADNKISKNEGKKKLSQYFKDEKIKDEKKNYPKFFPDKYTLFKYMNYLKKTGLIDCSNAKRNKTYFLTSKGLKSVDKRLIAFNRFMLIREIESASDEVIKEKGPEILKLLNER